MNLRKRHYLLLCHTLQRAVYFIDKCIMPKTRILPNRAGAWFAIDEVSETIKTRYFIKKIFSLLFLFAFSLSAYAGRKDASNCNGSNVNKARSGEQAKQFHKTDVVQQKDAEKSKILSTQ